MSWEMAWLNYKGKKIYKEIKFLRNIYTDLSGEIINNSINELEKVSKDIFNLDVQVTNEKSLKDGIILRKIFNDKLGDEGFCIKTESNKLIIEGKTESAILYGVFHLIRMILEDKNLDNINIIEKSITYVKSLG